METKVTVVIPTYNRIDYLPKAINSILDQTISSWKLVILDDGSTDNTKELISAYLSDTRISYVYSLINEGLGKTLQKGLLLVDTPYFMSIDSDDWVEPQTLEVLLNAMDSQPETTSLVCGNALYWQEEDNGELTFIREEKNPSFNDKHDFLFYGPTLTPRFYRTASVKSINGFLNDDPSGGRKIEDRYLLLRLIEISDFYSVNIPLYNILTHRNNMTDASTRNEFNEIKKFIYLKVLNSWDANIEPIFKYSSDGWLDVVEVIHKKENDRIV